MAKRIYFPIMLFFLCICSFLVLSCDNKKKVKPEHTKESIVIPEAYIEYEPELIAMRKNMNWDAPSSAERVFKEIDFLGMRKVELLKVLGEPYRKEIPTQISQAPSEEEKKDPVPISGVFYYAYDTGYGGVEFAIHINKDIVHKIEKRGFN